MSVQKVSQEKSVAKSFFPHYVMGWADEASSLPYSLIQFIAKRLSGIVIGHISTNYQMKGHSFPGRA